MRPKQAVEDIAKIYFHQYEKQEGSLWKIPVFSTATCFHADINDGQLEPEREPEELEVWRSLHH